MTTSKHLHTALMAALLLLATTACRRDLWVYTDELRQVELITDWSQATERPDGMSWWFMNNNLSGQYRQNKTSNVDHTWLALPRGTFTGIVFDYSPEEYAHIEFLGMTQPYEALAHLPPAADQPQPDDHLYGLAAVPHYAADVPMNPDGNGMYIVSAEPEMMNADTLLNVVIKTGIEDELIPWDLRDRYETVIDTQTLYAEPRPVVWLLRIRVAVRGLQYMYNVRATVAGLTDGCWLAALQHPSSHCLQALDNWQSRSQGDGIGYISTSANTFGLPSPEMPPSSIVTTRGSKPQGNPSRAAGEIHIYDEQLRLNLQFMLRDRQTVLNYHYDLGSEYITVSDEQLLVDIEIPIDFPDGIPDLPYVDEVDASGFDATVTPWEDGGTVDTTM